LLLRRAVTFENQRKTAFFSPAPMAFPYRQRSRTAGQSGDPALIDHYGKPMRGRTCFAEIILLHTGMILQKCQPLCLPGNGRMLVTASPKLALAKKG